MKDTLFLVSIVIVGWGLWGFFGKLATERIGTQTLIWSTIISLVFFIGYLLTSKEIPPFKTPVNGIVFALLTGISISIGSIAYYILLKKEPAGEVVTITALYPIVTILLSVLFLKEKVTITQTAGFILALISIYLINK
jgi:transporter family protein